MNFSLTILKLSISALTAPKLPPTDPLKESRLHGMRVKHKLLYSGGQPLVAQLLRISRQAVEKRRSQSQLLAVSLGKRGYFYPLWQFQDGDVLVGLHLVLITLTKFDPWMQLIFMETRDLRLNNLTPLECLVAGNINDVITAADCYGKSNPA